MSDNTSVNSEIVAAATPLRQILVPLIAISSVYNILLLAGSFFMLLVYDDVLPSRSVPSLISLLLMVTVAYAFQAFLDIVRGRIMVHVGTMFMRRVSGRVLDVMSRFELMRGTVPGGSQIVRDVDTIRGFLSSNGPLAFLDLPWIVVYLLILFIFHWSIGVLALIGVLVLMSLMILNNKLTTPLALQTVSAGSARYQMAETTMRSAETIKALGMSGARQRMWHTTEEAYLNANERLATINSNLSGGTKAFRMLLQSLTLALGAYLVIGGNATGGIIIAASILTARAVHPVEQVIGQWKNMLASRQAKSRLEQMFAAVPPSDEPMGLENPDKELRLQGLTSGPPGVQMVTVADVNLRLEAGNALAIVGPSGSGKTALARVLCGVWPALRGSVRLDGATLDQWTPDQIASIVGYVPQAIELFEGTIAQNIARFQPEMDREAVLAAAKAADVHEMVVRLPDGYDFQISANGGNLSAGQKQRIALARALYRDPFLIVLDEPNSNLDYDGERALGSAIRSARERGAIIVVIAHRPQVIEHVSHIMVMTGGRVESFETKQQFDERKQQQRNAQRPAVAAPQTVTGSNGAARGDTPQTKQDEQSGGQSGTSETGISAAGADGTVSSRLGKKVDTDQ